MTEATILLFHPDLAKSRANAALADAAWGMPGIEIVDMTARHPGGRVDANDDDVALLLAARRIVIQFPVYWYSTPPLLNAWQDAVLTRMFYIRAAEEGARLKDVPVMLAATAGNVPEAYSAEGSNLFPLAELLRPLQATAHRCGLDWADPHLLYRANRLDDAELAEAGRSYRARLENWIAATPGR